MADVANLQIRIQSIEAELAQRRLKGLRDTGERTERATDGLTAGFKRLLVPLAGVVSATAGLTKLISVGRQFGVLNAQLITATGSAENAAMAFEAIQDFASRTPYDLGQVTDSFTRLVNLGLDPSEAALTSYGNTASAMGRDLNQLIEAVADAATGEFERLKEFGIKARSQGDQVTFTFRGVNTTIGKNAKEIEGYLKALGENEFAGAMAERVNTLDGAISNLGDAWDQLFLTISQQGSGELIQNSIRLATDTINDFKVAIASGEIEGYIRAIVSQFDNFGRDITSTIQFLTGALDDFFKDTVAKSGTDSVAFLISAFEQLPTNIRTIVQLATTEVLVLIDKAKAYFQDAVSFFKNPFGESTLEKDLARIDNLRQENIIAITTERQVAIKSYDDQIKASQDLRAEYEKTIADRKAAGGDVLGQFAVQAPTATTTSQPDKRAIKLAEQRAKELEAVRLSLRTEEEAIQESYERRLAIILQNTEEGSAQRLELETRLAKERNDALVALDNERTSKILEGNEKLFSNLSDLSEEFAGRQTILYKATFAASKAFAIADAVIKIQQGIAEAASLPYPGNLAAIGSVVAATSGIISTISGTQFSGGRQFGGSIPAGTQALVGERGPELVQGPATVTSTAQTAQTLSQNQPQNNIRIINTIDPAVINDYLGSQSGEETILNVIRNNPEVIRAAGA